MSLSFGAGRIIYCTSKWKSVMQHVSTSCTFHFPQRDAWIYTLTSHAIFCVLGGIPIAVWTFYVGRQHRGACIPVALLVALSIPAYFNYWNESSIEQSRITWIRPFLGSTFGFSTAFKLWNVAFSQYPEGADATLPIFINWFLLLPEPAFHKGKTRKLSTAEIWRHVVTVWNHFVIVCVILSIMRTPTAVDSSATTTLHVEIMRFLAMRGETKWQEAWNGWIHLWWLYSWVSLLLELSILISMPLTGFQAMLPSFRNPLLRSRSFQEVWGTRWNLPVQVLLQRIAYVPLRRQGFSKPLAVLGTFLLSGVLHEYNFWTHNFIAYQPGIPTIFFLGMGIVMLVENSVWIAVMPLSIRNATQRYVPSALVSFGLIMVSAIPVERYFIQSWLASGMLDTAALLFPHITCA